MTIPSRIDGGRFQDSIPSAGRPGAARTVRSDRFDAVLHAVASNSTTPPEQNVLEALVRMIEEQVRTHRLFSLRTSCGLVSLPVSWDAGSGHPQGSAMSVSHHAAVGTRKELETPETIDRIIDHSAEQYGVDSSLIRAVIRAESDFDPRATSPKGAMGLMQLMPETARDLGDTNAYDPAQSVAAGTRYLRTLLDRYDGNTNAALAAYNWGSGNVERNAGRLPEETKTYISRVTQYRDQATAESTPFEKFHRTG